MKYDKFWIVPAGILTLVITVPPALAHVGVGPHVHATGFPAGFTHPWLGLDHLLAMAAVGLLAVRSRSTYPYARHALWLIPAGFVSGMLIGAAASYVALPVPGVELAIAASVIGLGLALALLPRVAPVPATLLVAAAGFFHGHAHITEMTGTVMSYAAGMVLATALLHATGVIAGLALARLRAEPALRASGAAMACTFTLLLAF